MPYYHLLHSMHWPKWKVHNLSLTSKMHTVSKLSIVKTNAACWKHEEIDSFKLPNSVQNIFYHDLLFKDRLLPLLVSISPCVSQHGVTSLYGHKHEVALTLVWLIHFQRYRGIFPPVGGPLFFQPESPTPMLKSCRGPRRFAAALTDPVGGHCRWPWSAVQWGWDWSSILQLTAVGFVREEDRDV